MRDRERIYIVPTWAGMVFAAAVFLIFAAGYALQGFGGTPQVLVIALLVAGIVVLIQTNDNLRGIGIAAETVRAVPAGTDAVIRVRVTNAGSVEHLGLRVRWREGWKLIGDAEIPVLGPGESAQVSLRLPTRRRGVFPVPPVWVSSNLPAGLCFAWKVLRESGTNAVYPRGRSWRPLPASAEARRAGAEDIGESRPYAPGDPINRVDWKVYARTGEMVVRTFEDPGGRLAIRWADTAFLADPEDRLEQMSAWVQAAVRRGRAFDLDFGSVKLDGRNLEACLGALAGWRGGP